MNSMVLSWTKTVKAAGLSVSFQVLGAFRSLSIYVDLNMRRGNHSFLSLQVVQRAVTVRSLQITSTVFFKVYIKGGTSAQGNRLQQIRQTRWFHPTVLKD